MMGFKEFKQCVEGFIRNMLWDLKNLSKLLKDSKERYYEI